MRLYRWRGGAAATALVAVWGLTVAHASRAQSPAADRAADPNDPVNGNARQLLDEGRRVFRYETFGDEAFWGDALKLHRAIEGAKFGGVGPGGSPKTALAVGLKVDLDVTGHFDAGGSLSSMGVQCALCHSTVDNSFAPGIGHRLDGWANRDLNVGAIVGLIPPDLLIFRIVPCSATSDQAFGCGTIRR